MGTSEDLIPVFIPSLVSLLLRHEQDKRSPLTEQEVLSIRDKATVVMVPRSATGPIFERRGYDDVDPERCWEQWQEARKQFAENP